MSCIPSALPFFTKYRPRPWFYYLLRLFSVPAHTVLLAITEVVLTKTDEGKGFVVIVTGNFIQPESPSEPTVPIYCGSQRLPSAFLGKCFVSRHANGWMALIGSQSHQNSPHFSKNAHHIHVPLLCKTSQSRQHFPWLLP